MKNKQTNCYQNDFGQINLPEINTFPGREIHLIDKVVFIIITVYSKLINKLHQNQPSIHTKHITTTTNLSDCRLYFFQKIEIKTINR